MKGQATVELALGSLVFVTVLLLGISFSEVTWLSMKVHEAATAALWDTTARELHEHATNYGPRRRAVQQAGPEAEALYGGFDGRKAKKGATRTQQVLVTGRALNVRCERDEVFQTSRARDPIFPGGEGGMKCTASAALDFMRMPRSFAEGNGGFFQVPHLFTEGLPACGLGRPENGRCSRDRGYSVLLDSWGLRGPKETKSCSLGRCKNDAFHDLVGDLYRRVERGAGRQTAAPFAQAVVGAAPGQSPREFRFSFWDDADPAFPEGDKDPGTWMTNVRTGSRNTRYSDRGSRFLGYRHTR